MQIAMTLPTMLPHGRAELLEWCRKVDDGPWSSLAVPERITYPSHSWIVELSAAAVLTSRVRLWTTIVILPAHPAVQVAKEVNVDIPLKDTELHEPFGSITVASVHISFGGGVQPTITEHQTIDITNKTKSTPKPIITFANMFIIIVYIYLIKNNT
jgi:hypothetical protein